MKRHSSLFRTTILAITASLCFTQAPLKAEGLLYEMGDWLKVHVNAAWNVEDLDSLKGTQKSLLLATTLLGTYLLADKIQSHDTSSRTTKKYCRWTKQAVKISLPIFALLGLYNTANNLGWGPGETLSALGTLLWTIYQMWPSIAGENQPPAGGISRQNFPPFDPQFRQSCPTLVPQKLAEVQDDQNPPHTLLCSSSVETMGSALFAETYKARKRTCPFKPIEEAVQYINLADCETPEDRAKEIDAAFNRFNYANLNQRFLYIDSIELLNTNELAKKLTDTLANLLVRDENDPHRVTVIAHTTKLGLVNPSILRLFDAGHRIELRASLAAEKSFVPTTDQEINAFISSVWPSATDQQRQALVAAHRGTTIKNLVDGITKAKLQKQIADQDSATSIDLDSNTEHAKKARERLKDALADESFTTYIHKPKQDQPQKKAEAARNEQEEKNLAQTLTELTAEESALNARIEKNQPDARWDLRTKEVRTKERQAELAKIKRAKARVEIKIKALAGAKARFEADTAPEIARTQAQRALSHTLFANSFVQEQMQTNPKVKAWAKERDAVLKQAQTQQDKDRLTQEFNKKLQELLYMQQNPRRFIDDMLGSQQITISKEFAKFAANRAQLETQLKADLDATHNEQEKEKLRKAHLERLEALKGALPRAEDLRALNRQPVPVRNLNGGAPAPQQPPVVAAPSTSSLVSTSAASSSSKVQARI